MAGDSSALQEAIGYQFKDESLLEKALTHTSSVSERSLSNERLEFFGDAVLDLIICEFIYNSYPDYSEGELTKIKGLVVSRKVCSKISQPLKLNEYIKVGKGAEKFGSLSGSIAAGVLEALIAAVYLDSGLEQTEELVLRLFKPHIIEAAESQHQGNYKSLLQQYFQKKHGEAPVYEIVDEQGPEHHKCFQAEALWDKKSLGKGWGMNKKEAEQKAAHNALDNLRLLEEDSQPEGHENDENKDEDTSNSLKQVQNR
ncbi:Ribonuclease 3 [Sedimentisphaera cyanobacteriorum]|uniref:Ribonuclease 3 n=1 Tax=Sedimentisphaera cyanobacteriorum TaxID=1940790 RepID=A0A1Q2HMB1_9BACT|nr:ribonuclease III [Sedimentisphaera cyanobacteriorum]AQQ08356.1 Ribonuclease 3 [Sedimentisphaera cyanobacteriorum]